MIDQNIRKIIQAKTGCAVVIAGSGSDGEHIAKIVNSLDLYEIPRQVRICSAHKQPEELMGMIDEYNYLEGSVSYIPVAGGNDALSGVLSYHTDGPVISCPPDAPNDTCLLNPPGSSNAYIANPKNAARFIAQIYSGVNPRFKELLAEERKRKIHSLRVADIEFQKKYEMKNGI